MKAVSGKDAAMLAVSIIICQMAGVVGSIPNIEAIPGWYATIARPSFTPPNAVFAPVWITLYFMMGVSVFLVWRKGLSARGVKAALAAFAVQLVLNTLWSYIFFGWKLLLPAFIEIVLLWIAIIVTIMLFRPISKAAAWLLAPYLVWVSYASALTFEIWRLN